MLKAAILCFAILNSLTALALDSQTTEAFSKIVNLDDQGNGVFSSGKYDARRFSIQKVVNNLVEENDDVSEENDCRKKITVGRTVNLEIFKKNKYINFPVVAKELEALHAAGKIRTIISNNWDMRSGETEACLVMDFYIYAKDGQMLYLNVDRRD